MIILLSPGGATCEIMNWKNDCFLLWTSDVMIRDRNDERTATQQKLNSSNEDWFIKYLVPKQTVKDFILN